MRNISFAFTVPQFLARTKSVTRRLGWSSILPGTMLQAVEKSQGLRRGEKVRRLGVIRVVAVSRLPLDAITAADCAAEGFPGMEPRQFVAMFCKHNDCLPNDRVTRIEFEHVAVEVATQ